MFIIGKKTEERDLMTAKKASRLQRTRPIQSGHCHVHRQQKAVHSKFIPYLNAIVGDWQGAWLLRRLGLKSIIQFQHLLARGIALRLASSGVAFDLMDAFSKLLRAGVWLLWWLIAGDTTFSVLLSSWYEDFSNFLVIGGRCSRGRASGRGR